MFIHLFVTPPWRLVPWWNVWRSLKEVAKPHQRCSPVDTLVVIPQLTFANLILLSKQCKTHGTWHGEVINLIKNLNWASGFLSSGFSLFKNVPSWLSSSDRLGDIIDRTKKNAERADDVLETKEEEQKDSQQVSPLILETLWLVFPTTHRPNFPPRWSLIAYFCAECVLRVMSTYFVQLRSVVHKEFAHYSLWIVSYPPTRCVSLSLVFVLISTRPSIDTLSPTVVHSLSVPLVLHVSITWIFKWVLAPPS